jgi:hypothetical protein
MGSTLGRVCRRHAVSLCWSGLAGWRSGQWRLARLESPQTSQTPHKDSELQITDADATHENRVPVCVTYPMFRPTAADATF